MFSCDHGDMVVVYGGAYLNSECPVCKLNKEIEELRQEIEELKED